jgi:hypothetical protein
MIISRRIILRIISVSETTSRENQNTHFVFNKFFRKSFGLWDNMEKYGTARQATDDNIIRRRKDAIYMQNNWGKDTGTRW